MTSERLEELERAGWCLTRDGSTATAYRTWEDPEDPDSGWEVMVLHTSGHGARFTLSATGDALSERPPSDARRLLQALTEAVELVESWQGELPGE